MQKKILERDIKKSIRDYLDVVGGSFFFPISLGGIGGRTNPSKGVSDILGVYRGQFVAIEVKRRGGVVSPEQQRFLERVRQSGGIALVAYSVDDVSEVIK